MNKGAPLRGAVLHQRQGGAERSRLNVEHSVISLDFLWSEIICGQAGGEQRGSEDDGLLSCGWVLATKHPCRCQRLARGVRGWDKDYPSHVTGCSGVYEQKAPVLSERWRWRHAEGCRVCR